MNNCFKCGNVLDNNYRCCMNCGAINPYHPDNKQTVEMLEINKNINTNIDVDNNVETINLAEKNVKDNSTINTLIFVAVNCIGYLILLFFLLTKNNDFTYNLIITSIIYFYLVCFQLMLKKADMPWWGIFIPIYNLFLINKLAFGNGWLFIVPVIPFALLIIFGLLHIFELLPLVYKLLYLSETIYHLSVVFCLGKRFGRSGLITLMFSFIVIPTIALSSKYQYE